VYAASDQELQLPDDNLIPLMIQGVNETYEITQITSTISEEEEDCLSSTSPSSRLVLIGKLNNFNIAKYSINLTQPLPFSLTIVIFIVYFFASLPPGRNLQAPRMMEIFSSISSTAV